jgi:hypothetical protein
MERPTRQRSAALWALASSLTLAAAALSLPPLRRLIEQSMVWHMVVQMPLLILAGWVGAHAAKATTRSHCAATVTSSWNQFGLTGGLTSLVALAYWMLPSSIDRALVVWGTDALKLASLWLCGALLRHSAARAALVVQLFFVGTALPMLVWAGLYFASTDLRLCNAYSLDSQVTAGRSVAGLAVALALWWAANAVWITRSSPD